MPNHQSDRDKPQQEPPEPHSASDHQGPTSLRARLRGTSSLSPELPPDPSSPDPATAKILQLESQVRDLTTLLDSTDIDPRSKKRLGEQQEKLARELSVRRQAMATLLSTATDEFSTMQTVNQLRAKITDLEGMTETTNAPNYADNMAKLRRARRLLAALQTPPPTETPQTIADKRDTRESTEIHTITQELAALEEQITPLKEQASDLQLKIDYTDPNRNPRRHQELRDKLTQVEGQLMGLVAQYNDLYNQRQNIKDTQHLREEQKARDERRITAQEQIADNTFDPTQQAEFPPFTPKPSDSNQ